MRTLTKTPHQVKFGDWIYNEQDFTLDHHGRTGYHVDLKRCTTSAEVLNWIFQIARKGNATPEMVGHLVKGLQVLLQPQRTLCLGPVVPTREAIAQRVGTYQEFEHVKPGAINLQEMPGA